MNSSVSTVDPAKSLGTRIYQSIRRNIQTYTLIIAVIVIWIIFYFATTGRYLDPQNISNLLRQMAVTSFLSIGMVLVIVTGNIDLSGGKFSGFVSVVVAYLQFYVWFKLLPGQVVLPAILSVICGLLIGLLAGVVQGYIIAYLGLPAFIVTLGGLWLFNGLILLVTQGKTIAANQPVFSDIAQGYIPVMWGWVIFVLIVAALVWNMFS